MPVNSVFSWLIKKRVHQIELFMKYPLETQKEVFSYVIDHGQQTAFGQKYGFKNISSIEEFKQNVPLQNYESLKPYIDRTIKGEQGLLWPTTTKWFAKSSGTTQDKSKFIPVTQESLEDCHYKGGKDLLGLYYNQYPKTKLYYGKHLAVSGSAQINELSKDSYFGDLSAIIIKNLPFWCEIRRTPSKEIALMTDWEEKIEKMARITAEEDVSILAGVPSWTLFLIRKVLELKGTDNLLDVWPKLELYMHGGVSFTPYKEQFQALIPSSNMKYVETYNASEGFFGIQNDSSDDMLLMLDYGIFYEFIPMENIDDKHPETVGLKDVEIGKNYAIVISTNGGLWRYLIGDTVKFTQTYPFKIKVSGRTKHYINAFGEEVIVDNADKAFAIACANTGASLKEYTGAPVFFTTKESGGHEWLVEFEKSPENLHTFAAEFDKALKSINSDYEAKRSNDYIMKFPTFTEVSSGTFYAWLSSKNKLGGQHKVPRLLNNRTTLDEIKAMYTAAS